MTNRTLGALLVAFAFFTTACSSADDSTTTSSPPATQQTTTTTEVEVPVSSGLVEFDGSANGFVMLMPEDYIIMTPDELDLEALLGDAGGVFTEDMAAQVQLAFEQGGVLFAFDFVNSSATFVDNINIIKEPKPPFESGPLQELLVQQYGQFGASIVSSEIITIPAGEVIVTRYTFPAFGSEGIGYVVIGSDSLFTVTVSAEDLGQLLYDPDEMVASFREV